ncbi:g6203 [Coccomyxa elongata]
MNDCAAVQEVEYNPVNNAAYWNLRPVLVFSRALEIVTAFSQWYLQGKWQRGGSKDEVDSRQAERLREILTRLGPAFVKIGQAVSSRPDVAPPSYTQELEKLQDQIPPFPTEEAMAVMQQDMGLPPSSVFSFLTSEPVAAASLGQVYRGRLREGGREVAVKVQRPGVRESIALDVHILRILAAFVRRWRRLNSDLPALLDEWAESLFKELDYRKEAANGIRFKELYGDLEGVYVPDMILEHTTGRVLVMEWVEGRRLRRAGKNGEGPSAAELQEDLKLVEIGVQCSLEQILEVGFHHADPHPGNLLRLEGGRLGYIDFGMMGNIEGPIRKGLIRATLHMVNREYGALADDFITLGLLPTGANRSEVVPALTNVFSKALKDGVSNVSFSMLSADLGRTMYEFSFRIPPYYTLLVRSLSVLEGIALSADRNYKVLGSAYPWIARRLLSDSSVELQETLRALLYKGNRFQFGRLESLLRQAVRSPPRSAVASGSRPGVQVSPGARALELLLGSESAYVRDIVTEELAKGLDAYWRLSADDALDAVRANLVTLLGMEGRPEDASAATAASSEGPAAALLEALLALPDLSTPEDREQLAGITSLAALLQELAASADGAAATRRDPVPDFLRPLLPAQAAEAAGLLQWLGAELPQLPDAERVEALRLPILLGAKVSSRIAARALRALLLPPASSANGKAQPATAPAPTTRSTTSRVSSPSPESSAVRAAATQASSSKPDDIFTAPSASPIAPPLQATSQTASLEISSQTGGPAATIASGVVPGPAMIAPVVVANDANTNRSNGAGPPRSVRMIYSGNGNGKV